MVALDAELRARGGEGLGHPAQVGDLCRSWADRLKPYLKNTEHLLNNWIDEGRSVLFEGAQGALLDVDHGTYPFVTSSNSTSGGACTGTGVPPNRIDGVIGVLKAYTTRVGSGPFLTELEDEVGEYLRKRGNEFGTTTGRPRRCGWLDLVAARYALRINGVDTIALTKLDVLDTLETIPVCIGYRYRGTVYKTFPAEFQDFENIEPVHMEMRGWKQSTVGVLEVEQLPAAAQQYIEFIEQELGVSISIVSTGPRREETAIRRDEQLTRLTSDRLGAVLARRSI
jgi:adenylosuccinate synthase